MSGLRPDLYAIAALVAPRSRVLDLGCGDGALLAHLAEEKRVIGRGIEWDEGNVLACVRRGLSVRQGNMVEGLADFPDRSFAYVILSQTLPYVDEPAFLLREMARVGRRLIVSFPNWGYWRCRLHLLLRGRVPPAPTLPHPWHVAPRWQALTVRDVADLCQQQGLHLVAAHYLHGARPLPTPRGANLLATTALWVLEQGDGWETAAGLPRTQ